MSRNASFPLLLVCFFLSGLAGLIYQTTWTREFAFVFGTSNLLAHRIKRPVLTYGVLEMGIGLSALGVPFAIHGSQALYVALLGGQPDLSGSGGLFTASFYLVCSFLILMVPTALMGATLPLLVRYSVHSDEEIGRRIGLLYSINTAGAVVGTIFAAFVLLPSIGLRQTIWVAAGVNGLVFLAAWALSRSAGGGGVMTSSGAPSTARDQAEPSESATSAGLPAVGDIGSSRRTRWILPLIFGSGLISFTYEVLWVRLLEHLLGGSVYAFSTMLASFLMGIAFGAAVASRVGSSRSRAAVGFAVSQLGIAGLSLLAFAAVDWIPSLTGSLRGSGYSKFFVDWSAATLTLFPAATLIGATFPFAVRILARDEFDAGRASARVYAVNTLGSVVGSIAAGFFIIPALGYAGTLIGCVAVNLLLALITASVLVDRQPRRLQIVAAIALVALAVLPPEQPLRILRYSELGQSANMRDPIRYLGVGRAATVLLLEAPSRWLLRTNGNPEGRISPLDIGGSNEGLLARWLSGLPSIVRPDLDSLLMVGFGGGLALETVPSRVEQIDVVELEPEVIEANRSIGEERWRDPLADPRLTLHLNDARNALLLTDKRFGAIVSQPSHPWSSGASHLYTREFFELAQDHLEPDGVFVQWIGLSFVDESLFRSLLATLTDVFEHVQVYNPSNTTGVLFLSSDSPFDIASSAARALAATPEDFEHLRIYNREDVLSSMLLDEEGVRELARGAEIIRDDYNIMQMRSPRILGSALRRRVHQLAAPYDPLVALATHEHEDRELDIFYLLRLLPPARGERLAETLKNPVDVEVAAAIQLMHRGKSEATRRQLDAALQIDPRHLQARSARLLLSQYAMGSGNDPATIVEMPLDAIEQAVLSGWIARAADDWEALRAIDPTLRAVPRRHPLSTHANILRAEWRIASDDPGLAEQAAAIIDRTVWAYRMSEGQLIRARANIVAENYMAALDALSNIKVRSAAGQSINKGLAKRANRVLRMIPKDPELARLRSKVEREFGQ